MASPATAPPPPLDAGPDPGHDRLRRVARYLEYTILAVALLFAFLTASSAVRNADFWLHLATASRQNYEIGVDPFAYTTAGRSWVNHAWLYERLVRTAYELLGNGVVIAKAFLVLALAGIMMTIRRREYGLWLPAGVTALALLAASPRLPLPPMLVSLLFEAVTLWLLVQGTRRREWLLPILFAAWVNLDAWFLLGPATLLVFTASDHADRHRMWTRSLILALGLAACLLNPHHVHAFQLPMELSPAVLKSPLLNDPRFARLFESPWHWERYTRTSAGLNPAGLAYFVLLGLGLVSFIKCRRFDWRL